MSDLSSLPVKRLSPTAKLPNKAYFSDAGFDLFSNETSNLKPVSRSMIKTGIALAIPNGHVGLIWDKSGLASKSGITVLGGVIDAGYTGEIIVTLFNTSEVSVEITQGQKIAQILIQAIDQVNLVEVSELNRGEQGFGSTGK